MRKTIWRQSLCLRCVLKLLQRRSYATSPNQCLTVPIPNRAFIELTGPDTVPFLQGLMTNNIRASDSTPLSYIYTAFLNAQGRVLNDAYVWPPLEKYGRSGWLVEVDKQESQSLLKHLKKHKLRSKLQVQLLEDGLFRTFSRFRRESSSEPSAEGRIDESLQAKIDKLAEYRFDDLWNTHGTRHTFTRRYISMQSTENRGDMEDLESGPQSSILSLAYQVHRMVNGLPEGPEEIIRESALPQESNIDLLGGIDFRKGCYLGQELTIRTHHTGVVRKRILPVQLYSAEEELPIQAHNPTFKDSELPLPPSGANISKVGATRGRSAGKWLHGVGNVGLALCRLEMMTDVRLTEESSPYNPRQEFRVTWEAEGDRPAGEVKLKAFVPQWMRDNISIGLRSHSRKYQPNLEEALENL